MPSKKKIILCVDDDADDRDLLCSVISELDPGISVILAENGVAANQLLKQAKEKNEMPCLVILDINMPLMDGRETIREIKKDTVLSAIPVVVFSTSSNQVDKQFFSKYGVEMVTKPDQMSAIYHQLKSIISQCGE